MEFILTVSAAASYTIIIVAALKMAWPNAPSYLIVLSAFISGILLSFLLAIAQGDTLTTQLSAKCALAGISAAAGAIGIRATSNKADKIDERVQTALDLPKGSTPSDVEAKMKKGK